MQQQQTLLRLPRVIAITGKGRSTIYSDVKAGTFPAPVKIGKRAIAWPASSIDRWVSERAGAAQ